MSTGLQSQQTELLALEELQGWGGLKLKQQRFVAALFEGCTQREAARRAGYKGEDSTLDVQASEMVRDPRIQAFMSQAWHRAGLSIDTTLRQAAELQSMAFLEVKNLNNQELRMDAFRRWKDASTLIASIHGRLQVNVKMQGELTLNSPGMIVIPEAALAGYAAMRRQVEEASVQTVQEGAS